MSSTVDAPTADPAVPAEPPRSPLAKRVSDLFFSPATLFAELRDESRPSWLAPVLIALAVAVLVQVLSLVMVTDLQLAELSIEQARSTGRAVPMSAEEMAGQMGVWRVVGLVVTIIWCFLRPFLVGLVLFLIFSVIGGGGAGYMKHVSVAAWAALVSALALLVTSLLQFTTGQLDMTLSVAAAMPDARGPLLGVLRAIGPFLIWLLILQAMGSSIVNRKRSWVGGFVALLAIVLVISAAFGMLGSAFGGGG
jgi:hypothetical protein